MFGGFGWRARMRGMRGMHGMHGVHGMHGMGGARPWAAGGWGPGVWAGGPHGAHGFQGFQGPLHAFFAHWGRWAQAQHGQHGQHGAHAWGCWAGEPTREQMIEYLERYQRDLEEETIAVAAKIKELREAGKSAQPGQQPSTGQGESPNTQTL